jgi:Terminase RNaseH-like domain
MSLFPCYLELERRLVAAGFPATSAWWLRQVERYFSSSEAQIVFRVGRRGGKSTTLTRVGLTEILFGDRDIPPGDCGMFAIISTDRSEAARKLRGAREMLDTLGVRYRSLGVPNAIQLVGRRVGVQVFTASIAGVSGFTAVFVLCDEVSKWKDADTGTNPATEVLASVRPTLAGVSPAARCILSSSPFGDIDAHAKAYDRGDVEGEQWTAFAETWVARPTLTEAETHRLEANEDIWRREYACVPMAGAAGAFFDASAISQAVDEQLELPVARQPYWSVVVGADFGFKSDSSACVVVCFDGERYVVAQIVELRPERGKPLRPSEVAARFAAVARSYGASTIIADQFSEEAMREHLAAAGVALEPAPKGATGKVETYTRARALFHEGRVLLPNHPRLVNQLLSVVSRPTSGGNLSITSPRKDGGHGDVASALVLALAAAPALRQDTWLDGAEREEGPTLSLPPKVAA